MTALIARFLSTVLLDARITIGLRRIFDPLAPLAGLALSA
jgi:hypothetical protein